MKREIIGLALPDANNSLGGVRRETFAANAAGQASSRLATIPPLRQFLAKRFVCISKLLGRANRWDQCTTARVGALLTRAECACARAVVAGAASSAPARGASSVICALDTRPVA